MTSINRPRSLPFHEWDTDMQEALYAHSEFDVGYRETFARTGARQNLYCVVSMGYVARLALASRLVALANSLHLDKA